jgi:hypothetical protein
MDLKQAISISKRIEALPWFTLPLDGVKIDIGNGFVAWHEKLTRGGPAKLFVADEKKLTEFLAIEDDNEGEEDPWYWVMSQTQLHAARLNELVGALEALAAVLDEEDDEPSEEGQPQEGVPANGQPKQEGSFVKPLTARNGKLRHAET